ncbi:aminoacyl-tRNA hydrolase [Candidatus Jorgensenbacteria bacterium]|nr:aminoacyl-tRNA hydrolase [Candidatus Jorgensenbacteria bacterium]
MNTFITEDSVRSRTARSSGPGGSRANRRSTKVQLWVKVDDLPLNVSQKKLVREKLNHHINHRDEIEAWCEEDRSQSRNRERALEHLNNMIGEALKVPLRRIPTEPPRNLADKRIRGKKVLGEKKRMRRLSTKGNK